MITTWRGYGIFAFVIALLAMLTTLLPFCGKAHGAEQVNVGVVAPYVIRKDIGGIIGEYILKYKGLEWTPIIVDGECNSSCTLVLANKHVCATDRAFFYFHGAHNVNTGAPSPNGTALLWARYPQKVQDWITAHGGLTQKWIGAKATVFLPLCKDGKVS